MMIDISTEEVISPAEATRYVPGRRKRKKPNVATIYRWHEPGVRGVRLEFIQIGSTRCTSVEALQRFFDALTAQAESAPVPTPPKVTRQRRREIDAAESRLAKAGI